ncbi:hypothetical protein Gotur_023462 [Gossypium turneri]
MRKSVDLGKKLQFLSGDIFQNLMRLKKKSQKLLKESESGNNHLASL